MSFLVAENFPLSSNKNVTLIRRKNIRRGRTYRLMIASVENIGDYAAVLYWLVSRRLDSYGDSDINVSPYAVVVIDRDGTPTCFSRACYAYGCLTVPAARWKPVKRMFDPSQTRYRSYEATNGIKLGGWAWGNVPDVTGKTGEKTGLADYVREGGGWPFLYLLFWRRYPVIENVVKSGWTFTLDDCIATDARNKRYRLRFPDALEELMDWNYARPRDILNVSRKAAAMGREWQWDCATFCLWKGLFDFGCALPEHAEDFQNYLTDYGYQNMDRFVACVTDGHEYAMSEIDPYLKRQRRKYGLDLRTGMEALFDYRFMLDKILDGRTPGEDELWPKNLRTAHDRAVTAYHAKEQSATAGFAEILERWGALQWTDGKYCAILPRCLADLTNEGHTLHHCVGSYSKSHAEGKIVVFIRHYRRPERSWFTLNEDLTGDRPRRIQLHGYGNEYANGKRLTIPKKVLDFCDRWERDVLIPVFREVMENEAKRKATKKRKAKAVTNRAAP